MSKITEIEKAITQLGPGEFQKFCDSFLSRLEKYGTILSLGMESGTSKTTIGNPDTYFRKENGKYVFVVYTTQQNNIYSKINEDIEKSLDSSKTDIDIKDIEEIICCHTSSKLSAGDDKKLREYCANQGIQLSIFGVDEIARQIYQKFPILAKDFLGISVDTNQIMSANDFVDVYDSNEMAAPLDTKFLHREKELQRLKDKIRNNSVVIIYGRAGVGKTRIALEASRQFSQENNYSLLCVKNNNLSLYEDLISYTCEIGQYLFFVDDANELADLEHILQYIQKRKQGYDFHIVLTVRDYVKEQVFRTAQKFTNPFPFELTPFTDDEIKNFLDVNMEIRNSDYVAQIIRIAEGNPRIAYMAGKLAKDTRSLNVIHDVSQLYEQYYALVIQSKLGDNLSLCLTMGILALIRAVTIDNMDSLEGLLNVAEISKKEFCENIQRLSSMEVVEISPSQVATLSDQCLANYMLYYVFFEKKLLPFSKVLEIGFKHFREGLIQSMNTLLNLFAKDSLHEYMESEIKTAWNNFHDNNDPCYFEFVKKFHTFQPEEAFILAEEKIEKLQYQPFTSHKIDFKKSPSNSYDDILGLMTGYKNSHYMEIVVDLLMSFVEKSEENVVKGVSWLKSNYYIDGDSIRYDFYTENVILKALSKYLDNNELCQRFILKYISYVLSFEFQPSIYERGNFLTQYIHISLSNGVKEYRKTCWDIIGHLMKYIYLHDELYNILYKYAISIRRAKNADVVEYDCMFINNIIPIIQCSNLKRSLLIREFQYEYKRHSLSCPNTKIIPYSEEWNLYQLLEDKFYYSELTYDEFKQYRNNKLIKYARNLSISDIPEFIKKANSLVEEISKLEEINDHSIVQGIQEIVDNASINKESAEILLISIIDFCSNMYISPCIILRTLFELENVNDVWNLIESRKSSSKNNWEFAFFQQVPEDKITDEIYHNLLLFFKDDSDKELKSTPYRDLCMLDKYLKNDTNIYVTVSKIIFEKRLYNSLFLNIYFEFLFNETNYTPSRLIDLFKSDLNLLQSIYFFMLECDSLNDYEGVYLSEFLKINDSWGETYVDLLIKMIKTGYDRDYDKYNVLWLSDDYIKYYDKIFLTISEEKNYYYSWQLENLFHTNISSKKNSKTVKQRQENWILHIVQQYSHDERIIALFVALAEVSTDIRQIALIEFLKNNDDFEIFERLPLDASHYGGEISTIIPDLQNRINYLESLLPYVSNVKYLHHQKRIKDRIEYWKDNIKYQEQENIRRKLFN